MKAIVEEEYFISFYVYKIRPRAGLQNLAKAVQEIGVSLHNGGPIKAPLQPLQCDSVVRYGGFQGDPQLALL